MTAPRPDPPIPTTLPTVPLAQSHCRGDEGVVATPCVSNPMERSRDDR